LLFIRLDCLTDRQIYKSGAAKRKSKQEKENAGRSLCDKMLKLDTVFKPRDIVEQSASSSAGTSAGTARDAADVVHWQSAVGPPAPITDACTVSQAGEKNLLRLLRAVVQKIQIRCRTRVSGSITHDQTPMSNIGLAKARQVVETGRRILRTHNEFLLNIQTSVAIFRKPYFLERKITEKNTFVTGCYTHRLQVIGLSTASVANCSAVHPRNRLLRLTDFRIGATQPNRYRYGFMKPAMNTTRYGCVCEAVVCPWSN